MFHQAFFHSAVDRQNLAQPFDAVCPQVRLVDQLRGA